MKYVLILWLTFLNSPHANNSGALAMETFDSHDACYFALAHMLEKARHVAGICVPKGGEPLREQVEREFRELERASEQAACAAGAKSCRR